MSKKNVVAVIGATGNVGSEILNYLFVRNFPIKEVLAAASSESVGKKVSFGNKTIPVQKIEDLNFNKIDIAFFCTNSIVSGKYIKQIRDKGVIIIDKSSYFRLCDDVPLIVPEVNSIILKEMQSKIIANPNCCTIPLAMVLKPLDNVAKIKRVVISTYQSVSGAGKEAMDELYYQTKAKYVFGQIQTKVFSKPIAFNLFPHIGNFNDDGSTEEETKIGLELKKIMGSYLSASVTCVRVPVFVTHSMSVNIEFTTDINATEVEEILSEADGIITYNYLNYLQYATPLDAVEKDEVFVSRIRNDLSQKNSINLWITADNLRKGAALNAIQIAEFLIKNQCSLLVR